jgi:hypothetical protein
MFFTKVGFVLAWLCFVPSAIGYVILTVAISTDNLAYVAETFGNRFVASSGSFAEGIAIGVAFGIAAEISRTVSTSR